MRRRSPPAGGPAVMAEQIDRLITAQERENITLQVIRTLVGSHPEMEQIARYTPIFDHLRAIALGPGDSAAYIQDIKDRFR